MNRSGAGTLGNLCYLLKLYTYPGTQVPRAACPGMEVDSFALNFKQINGQAPNQKPSGWLRSLPVVHNPQRHGAVAVLPHPKPLPISQKNETGRGL